MNKTQDFEMSEHQITVTRKELPLLLGCGQPTADQIAKAANARIYIGKRLLISIDKVREYVRNTAL